MIWKFTLSAALLALSFHQLALSYPEPQQDPNATIAKLKGWYSRALANPYPTSDTFNWTLTKDQLDIFVESGSMSYGSKFVVAFLRDNDNQGIVVDSMGRVLLPPGEDYEGMVNLAQHIVQRKFFDWAWVWVWARKKLLEVLDLKLDQPFQYWWVDSGGVSCRPLGYWHVRAPGEGWKEHTVSNFKAGENRRLEKRVNGVKTMPKVLHAFMSLTYEERPEGGVPDAGHENVRRAVELFRGYYYYKP